MYQNNLADTTVRLRTAVTSILVAFENETGALQEFTNGLIKSADWMLEFGNNATVKGVIDAASSAAIVFAGVMGRGMWVRGNGYNSQTSKHRRQPTTSRSRCAGCTKCPNS